MIRILILLAASVFLFYSCEEDFNPYAEYKESYALTCILKSDSTFQVATLSHSYPPGEFNSGNGAVDPSIVGADIRIWYGDSVYIFKDSSVTRTDTSRYSTPFRFYYNSRFKVRTNKNIEIEVLLQNGRRLKANSTTPGEIFFQDESTVLVPPVNKNIVQFYWDQLSEGTFYSSKFGFRYRQLINGEHVEKIKEIPVRYIQQGNEFEAVFPDPDNASNIVYSMDAVTRALNEISDGDANKQNYSVYEFPVFDLIALDLPSSRYVSSIGQLFDDLTVSVNVSDYTNIEGGLGIFGSYTKKNYDRVRFFRDYIESFGYNFIQEN